MPPTALTGIPAELDNIIDTIADGITTNSELQASLDAVVARLVVRETKLTRLRFYYVLNELERQHNRAHAVWLNVEDDAQERALARRIADLKARKRRVRLMQSRAFPAPAPTTAKRDDHGDS